MTLRHFTVGMALALAILLTAPLFALALGSSAAAVIEALTDPEVLGAVATSVLCAAGAVLFALLLGVPAGLVLARGQLPGLRFWNALVDLPVVIPHPIVGLGLLLVFARHSLVGAALRDHFAIEVASATPGIIIAMFTVSAPFLVKAARDGFHAVPRSLERAARSLGASETRIFFTVSLPLAARSIRSGALLAWARSVSEFGSIVILAYYPRTAPVLIWDRFTSHGLQAALAPALVLLVVCLLIFLLLQLTNGRAQTSEEIER